MIKLKIEPIIEYLLTKNYKVKLQPETQQAYLLLEINKAEYPLFIRIFDENFLQLLLFFPQPIKKSCFNDSARLLHLINKEIDIPGFCMDEENGHVFYRTLIPAIDQKVEENLLVTFIESCKFLCQTFSSAIENVASGSLDFATVFERTREAKKP
ncbi:YbjN domain-containing protein [Parachlamydia sp. AcF125]|uniref:YbjN domain-containing protein n=1 Tax=Parachlamydia sp. AcF125 TaxID=2795736 RepID=UPI001BC97750|nr:YbjN domain-containing protein [Parachlamydia sp. AcF125]MBS4169184.1 hypothetical protein [Parachlamydia sp. AcF125]